MSWALAHPPYPTTITSRQANGTILRIIEGGTLKFIEIGHCVDNEWLGEEQAKKMRSLFA